MRLMGGAPGFDIMREDESVRIAQRVRVGQAPDAAFYHTRATLGNIRSNLRG